MSETFQQSPLSPSAHVDGFCRENLPPQELWPEFVSADLAYGDRLNCAVELLDAVADRLGGDRPCLLAPGQAPWTYDDLMGIKRSIEANGLVWEAIENFDPAHWHDVLLDGPKKREQMELLKRTIQVIGTQGTVTRTITTLSPGEVKLSGQVLLADSKIDGNCGFFAAGEIGPIGSECFLHGFTATVAVFAS